MRVPEGSEWDIASEWCRSYYHRYLIIHGKYLYATMDGRVVQKPLVVWQ